MPEGKCRRWCLRHCRPKSGRFWNNFCQSPSPWSYLSLFLVLVNLFHLVYFAAWANNFGSLSYIQGWGYFFTCLSGALLFTSGLYSIHALNVLWPSRSKVIGIEAGLGITLVFIVASLGLYFHTPSKREIKEHVYDYFSSYGRNPVCMQFIELEKKCCGIDSFEDYALTTKFVPVEGIDLPGSCCKRQTADCDKEILGGIRVSNMTELNKRFNTKGCIRKGYWDLRYSAPRTFFGWTTYFVCTILHLVSCVIILIIFNYYIYYEFPSRRHKFHAVRRVIQSVFKERDEIIEEATSHLEIAEYEIEGPAILEWYNMHYLPKYGLYGNTTDKIARDGFVLPKRYEFPLFPFDEYKKHPETFKIGTNLDMYEGTEVYESPETSDEETDTKSNKSGKSTKTTKTTKTTKPTVGDKDTN